MQSRKLEKETIKKETVAPKLESAKTLPSVSMEKTKATLSKAEERAAKRTEKRMQKRNEQLIELK